MRTSLLHNNTMTFSIAFCSIRSKESAPTILLLYHHPPIVIPPSYIGKVETYEYILQRKKQSPTISNTIYSIPNHYPPKSTPLRSTTLQPHTHTLRRSRRPDYSTTTDTARLAGTTAAAHSPLLPDPTGQMSKLPAPPIFGVHGTGFALVVGPCASSGVVDGRSTAPSEVPAPRRCRCRFGCCLVGCARSSLLPVAAFIGDSEAVERLLRVGRFLLIERFFWFGWVWFGTY